MNWNEIIKWEYQTAEIPAFSYEKPNNTPTPMQLLGPLEPVQNIQRYKQQRIEEVPPIQMLGKAQEPQHSIGFRLRKGLQVFGLKSFIMLIGIAVFFAFLGNPQVFTSLGAAISEGFWKFMSIFD